jgi:hypothetical protein
MGLSQLGTTQELSIVHFAEVCSLDGMIGVKGIRDPVVAVVVSMACYLRFISYGLTLIALRACSSCWLRLSSRILSCITGDVLLLGTIKIGGVVDNIVSGKTSGISSWIGCCIGRNIDWLHDLNLTTSLSGHGLKLSIVVVVTTMARSLLLLLEQQLEADLLYPGPLSSTWVVVMRM